MHEWTTKAGSILNPPNVFIVITGKLREDYSNNIRRAWPIITKLGMNS